jgi:hypothetical protein
MTYLEDTNGEPIDGRQAADIREFARKIWACFYNEEIALTKWGNAEKNVEDRYTHVGHGTGHTAGRITNTVPVTCNTIPVHILHLQVRAKHTVFFFTPYYGYHGILLTP